MSKYISLHSIFDYVFNFNLLIIIEIIFGLFLFSIIIIGFGRLLNLFEGTKTKNKLEKLIEKNEWESFVITTIAILFGLFLMNYLINF
jgi:hypothetical protein